MTYLATSLKLAKFSVTERMAGVSVPDSGAVCPFATVFASRHITCVRDYSKRSDQI